MTKAAPKKTTTTTTKKKETKQAGMSSAPLIDTNLAAEAAAKLIASRVSAGNAAQGVAKESSGFKNMKQGLSKPHLAGMNSVLNQGGPTEGKKIGGGQLKQVGHNQTFGSDSSRAFVPRRTGG